jgi:CheY-like chemotaxis protein
MPSVPVLIVDDNPANRKLMTVLLRGEGYDVHSADCAEAALRVLQGVCPRVIFMDIQLPGMDGLELTRRLKADPLTRDIVVVALTAYAMKGDDDRALAAGCDHYLAKPIDTRTFPQFVASCLSAS